MLLILAPSIAVAVGFGDINVNSKLGEPLNIEVELLSATPAELGTMEIGLASRSDFTRANMHYPDNAALFIFDIVEKDSGKYVVLITSQDLVNDTYLHLLLSASWAGGKVVREYTALLDPPLYSGEPAGVVEVAATGESEQTSQVSSSDISSSGSSGSPSSITVQRGDTLSGIVSRLNTPDSVSLYQGLTALLEANPDAFVNGNMNRLIAGANLNVPSFESMAQINRQVAVQNFQTQVADYNQYVSDVGFVASIADEEITDDESVDQALAEESDAIEEVASAELAEINLDEIDVSLEAEQDDGASLSIGQETSDEDLASAISGDEGDAAQVEALKTQLAQLDESLLASGVESEEVKRRLAEIQAQVERVSKIIEIEDESLAMVEDRAGTDDTVTELDSSETGLDEAVAVVDESGQLDDGGETGVAESTTIQNIDDTGADSLVEDQSSDNVESTSQIDTSAESSEAVTAAAVETSEEVVDESEDDSPQRQVVETSIMDSVTGIFGSISDYVLKIAAGLIALIAGLFFYRRRKFQREFDESMLDIESGQISANTEHKSFRNISAASGIDLVSGGDSGFELTIGGGMSYLSEEAIAGVAEEENEVIQSGAVDPLAEADVYLAYDRGEQAIQVLKEAYGVNPERTELAEKLLEIYHKQDDRIAFDGLAKELRARIGARQNPIWTKIIAMGKEVSPNNTLYDDPADISVPSLSESELDAAETAFDLPDLEAPTVSDPSVSDPSGAVDLPRIDDITLMEIDADAPDFGIGEQEDTAIKSLEIDDLELSLISDDEAPDRALDAPTLSQIITAAEAEAEVEEQEKLKLDVEDSQADVGDEDDGEIQFNLGDDVDDDFDDDVSSELVSVLEQMESKAESQQNKGVDQDSYLTEASEQSISKLEPYHESETALELAKAYLELGEKDIAKGFIEEVINEGSDKQKAKAEKLVKELID